jgi:hypothetical protein
MTDRDIDRELTALTDRRAKATADIVELLILLDALDARVDVLLDRRSAKQ